MTSEDWHRVVTLTQGVVMVVTDLHGDWDAYQRYRDLFIQGHQVGDMQYLVISGDLIHRESAPQRDKSLEMVLDVLELQETYPDRVIYLCGNHEFPHIYNTVLAKGNFVYTPGFEARLGKLRAGIVERFEGLPFYVRTSAGVAITHAGAAAPVSVEQNCYRLFTFDHQRIFDHVDQILQSEDLGALREGVAKFSGESYQALAKNYFAVSGKDDPRYDDLLRGFLASNHPDFTLLKSTLFTRCEEEYGETDYGIFLNALLHTLSGDFHPQNFLVAGHLNVKEGYQVVAGRHLRIASGKHTLPPKAARYLLFDSSRPVRSVRELVLRLRSV